MRVLLNSGGKDTLASLILAPPGETHSLYLSLGQPNTVAAQAAAAKIGARCASHRVITVSGVDLRGSSPAPGTTTPLLHVFHQTSIAFALGASYAATLDAGTILSGLRMNVGPGVPVGLKAMFETNKLNPAPTLLLPVFFASNEDIWKVVSPDPLWRETVTCNEEPPCGACARCALRAEWLAR